MKDSTYKLLDKFYQDNEIAKGIPATEIEISNAEKELGIIFDNDYKNFQLRYGGSVVGSTEVYGFHNTELMGDNDMTVVSLTELYRSLEGSCIDRLIIGSDYTGNYIGINRDGNVVMNDHDIDDGELIILAETFEQYIIDALNE